MQIFQFKDDVIGDYAKYIKSFINVVEPSIQQKVQESLASGLLWRDPLVQLNPTFKSGATVDQLVSRGVIHPECGRILRRDDFLLVRDGPTGCIPPVHLARRERTTSFVLAAVKNFRM